MKLQLEPVRIAAAPKVGGTRQFQVAMEQLARALTYAMDTNCSPWDFAVEIESLAKAGLTTSDLRWLVAKGYIEHALETTRHGAAQRQFQTCRHLAFGKRTCFVLTDLGKRQVLARALETITTWPESLSTVRHLPPALGESPQWIPTWDNQRRILRVGGQIVKHYRVPSLCQEAILSAFEEEQWPPAIDDPLPPHIDQDSKRRLRNTIQSLNANQKNAVLCFRGDGSGVRILWELRVSSENPHFIPLGMGGHAA